MAIRGFEGTQKFCKDAHKQTVAIIKNEKLKLHEKVEKLNKIFKSLSNPLIIVQAKGGQEGKLLNITRNEIKVKLLDLQGFHQ